MMAKTSTEVREAERVNQTFRRTSDQVRDPTHGSIPVDSESVFCRQAMFPETRRVFRELRVHMPNRSAETDMAKAARRGQVDTDE